MNKVLEDKLGRLAMMTIFVYLCIANTYSFLVLFELREGISFWPLALLSQLCTSIFVGFCLFYTVDRLPARDSAVGIMPRIVAVTGTFFMMALAVMPPELVGPIQRVISTLMISIGASLSIWCLNHLGRSFSIMATSRELKTKGSYAIVRHPLYAAEVVMIMGVVLGHGSPFAFAVGGIWLLLQIRRAQYEESVLRKTFSEYEDYARRVPMLIPAAVWPSKVRNKYRS